MHHRKMKGNDVLFQNISSFKLHNKGDLYLAIFKKNIFMRFDNLKCKYKRNREYVPKNSFPYNDMTCFLFSFLWLTKLLV